MSNGESAPAPEARLTTPPAKPAVAVRQFWLFRAVILVVVLGSVAVAWWSFARVMAPRLKESRDLSSRIAQLSAEVDDLDRQWTRESAAKMTNEFSRAESKLFAGETEFESWLANLRREAAPPPLT